MTDAPFYRYPLIQWTSDGLIDESKHLKDLDET